MSSQTREAKKRRARSRRRRGWISALPYVLVVGLAAGIVVALFLVSAGGGGSNSANASYPPGYTPPTLGETSAPVELVMWGDFQCPFCKRFEQQTLPELRRRYVDTGQVKFVWRDFEHYGEESHSAAVAAHCAGEQSKFWQYHDILYQEQRGINQGTFVRANLQRYAAQLQLDAASFNVCLDSGSYDAVTAADFRAGRSQDVNGTPAFFINGDLVVGAQPTETFASLIDSKLRQASQPGG